jgi:phosphoglycerol transferase
MSPPRQQILASKNIWKAIGAYAVAVALCLIILAWAMKLWDADLRIPFFYGGDVFRDVLQASAWIKGVIDNGWYQHNSFIGMPAGQDMYDFTITASLDFTIIKLITFFAPNYAMTLNLYFLLTFPLTTLTTMLVLRQLKVSYASSIVGSLLFTFVPYHFLRGEEHLFLSAYYMIPLIVMVILWIYTDKSFLFNADKNNSKLRFGLLNYKSMISIIICILVSSTCIYYAFFSCFLLVIAGVSSSISQKNKYPLLTSGILIAVIIIGGLINASPALIYQHEYGSNPEVAIRGPEEAEYYGLKIIQLLMPINGHRIPFMANIADKYCRTAPLVNENKFSSLGIIGSLGFLILIGWVFYRLSGGLNVNVNVKLNNTINELNGLSILNLSAVLLATIGGFGAIFNYAIYSQLRCYNRISIFIAFFSLLAVILLLEIFSQKHIKTKTTRLLFYGFLGLILIVGIMDQSTESYAPPYSATKAEYLNDADFINKIESIMPENAMIFQLPYVPYPENPPVHKMSDYSHFKGYLHSNDLRWGEKGIDGKEQLLK